MLDQSNDAMSHVSDQSLQNTNSHMMNQTSSVGLDVGSSVYDASSIGVKQSNMNPQQQCILIKDVIYYSHQDQLGQSPAGELQQTGNIVQSVSDMTTTPTTSAPHSHKPKYLNSDILSPSSNSSSSPSSLNNSSRLNSYPYSVGDNSQMGDFNPNTGQSYPGGGGVSSSSSSSKFVAKKTQKKKSNNLTSELDEERTSQLVSEILKNIKEKTKQLESMNQNLKSGNNSATGIKFSSLTHTPADVDMSRSQDSYQNEENSLPNESIGTEFHHQKKSSSFKSSASSSKTNPSNARSAKATLTVPIGWSRIVDAEEKLVHYVSPSGYRLKSQQDIRNYLLSDDTCKCGLECPLNIYEVFNFNPAMVDAKVKAKPSANGSCKCATGGKKVKGKILDELSQNSPKAVKRPASNDGKVKTSPAKKRIATQSQTYDSPLLSNVIVDNLNDDNSDSKSLASLDLSSLSEKLAPIMPKSTESTHKITMPIQTDNHQHQQHHLFDLGHMNFPLILATSSADSSTVKFANSPATDLLIANYSSQNSNFSHSSFSI